ncbi:SsrA-binding protein SmpB [Candidatus Pacearchaeota archaeon]|nr:SsrA-binding protein SmpB [Candidatus Pacearchaeota archaeon]
MKIIHKNKKVYFDYEILQEFTAGIALTGAEVKSVRGGHVNLKGAYMSIQKGEAFLKNSHISKYSHDQSEDYDPFRIRKLLLNKREIEKMSTQLNTQGISIAALAIGLVGRNIKVLIAVVRGKKKHDKRDSIKGREQKRVMDRLIKNY